ncbi:MAG: HsmA family protein [Candidatus Caldatribacteriota bacterium]|nr:HsmA family protein [Candidatus Caldatribacteriota bacterium]
MLIICAVILMFLALICYSVGVWAERLSFRLKLWHLAFFWSGLIFDTSGTTIMTIISNSFKFNLHGITGAMAIFLMAFHAIWATIVLKKKNEKIISKFHTFSLFVWLLWLIPFFTGMFLNM